ncbi:MAG: MFS transporter [Bacteroidetes bacterium]|nr:MFS transporter [Bacteroidota bacterium]MDA0888445.1 MFS transporter [Bacteroidota bacterium]MDA1084505.1 MFS transporter [Bacteroidota bacterium]
MPSHKKGDKKLLRAWVSYDWANSVYFLVISSTIFPLYYGFICGDQTHLEVFGMQIKNTALISYVTAMAFVVIALWSPILSGIADYMGNKKRFMQFYCYLGAASCVGLYWFEIQNIYWGLLFYFLALVGAWSSLVFYNSYLPDIAFPEQQNRISARGFALGYIGSVLLLLVNLFMVLKPDVFGITGDTSEASLKAMRYSFVSVGVWWFAFSHIAFYHLPRGNKDKVYTKDIFFNGYRELKSVWKSLKSLHFLKRYLGAFFVFSMALQTVMLVAAYFGEQEISWSAEEKTTGLIVSILLIQIIAIFGALMSSKFANRWGNIKTLILLNAIWVILCVSAYFIYEPIEFYVVAGFVGLCMGGIQSVARSTYSQLIPETLDTTSYFSFYDVAEKVGIVIGMLMYATVDQVTGSMRNAILFFVVFFFVGGILLIRLERGNKQAL